METILWILCSIIAIVVVFFFIGIFIAKKISDANSKRKLDEIYNSSQLRKKDKTKSKNSDEFKARDERKEIVTGQAVSQEYEKLQEKEEKFQEGLVKTEKEKGQGAETIIVDVAKPVGFWSRLIMSQKLGFIIAMRQQMNRKNNRHYFQNLIKAQAQSKGKEKGMQR